MSQVAALVLSLAFLQVAQAAPEAAAGKAAQPGQAAGKPAQPSQTPKTGTSEDFDADMVAGHPEGLAPPLPKQVSWDLSKAVTASTSRRERISLAGPWRFAASPKRDTQTLRKEMGWIDMPAGKASQWKTYDSQMRATTKGANKADSQPAWYWCEREITAPAEWIRDKIYLVIRGPWSQAELFVGYLPVEGFQRDGGRWFEITEALFYGGDAPLALRLKAEDANRDGQQEPYIGLELMPTGPRVDALEVRQDPQRKQLELALDLARPKFILGLPVRLSEIPLIVQFRLENADTGEVIQRFDEKIGPMPKETRSVSIRVDWSKEGAAPPARMRLKTRLTSALGGNLDTPYPLEFEPRKLKAAAEAKADTDRSKSQTNSKS